MHFTSSPLIALSYPFNWRLISCQGKDIFILCAYTESFTNAFLISFTDLISSVSTYPDTSMVFVILKSVSMQKEWKKERFSLLRLYEWNLWYEIIKWFTFSLLSVITSQISWQKLLSLQSIFNIHSEYSLQEVWPTEKIFITVSISQILSLFFNSISKFLPCYLVFFFLFSALSITDFNLS